jgi:hypothetical protein
LAEAYDLIYESGGRRLVQLYRRKNFGAFYGDGSTLLEDPAHNLLKVR